MACSTTDTFPILPRARRCQALATDIYIVGDEVADTTAVDGDKVVLINPAKRDQAPARESASCEARLCICQALPMPFRFIVRVG